MYPRPVVIVDYDLRWPILYEKEKLHILKAIGHKVVDIEHVGSTAVPGLGGKPIIDIMAGVFQSTDADDCIPLLQDLDYKDVTPQPQEPDWYYCLSKAYQGETVKLKNYHLHLVKHMTGHWEKHLLFRDFLRVHPDVAQQYYKLKKKLATKYGSNRIGYTEAKMSFIESIIAQTRQRKTQFSTDNS